MAEVDGDVEVKGQMLRPPWVISSPLNKTKQSTRRRSWQSEGSAPSYGFRPEPPHAERTTDCSGRLFNRSLIVPLVLVPSHGQAFRQKLCSLRLRQRTSAKEFGESQGSIYRDVSVTDSKQDVSITCPQLTPLNRIGVNLLLEH